VAEVETVLAEGASDDGFLGEIARRWADTRGRERARGITGDVVLLHVATMTNLFAALGWTLALLLLHPDVLDRVRADEDPARLERCVLESIRLGQRSIMMRAVLTPCELPDGEVVYRVGRKAVIATMLPLTNLTAAPGLDAYDPERWAGRRLRDEGELAARELVTTFGHGPHRCPAQRFSLSAIGRAVRRLLDTYELEPGFTTVRPLAQQIGGMARAADPCPVTYRSRA
jgi:cytochrome P450